MDEAVYELPRVKSRPVMLSGDSYRPRYLTVPMVNGDSVTKPKARSFSSGALQLVLFSRPGLLLVH